MSYLHGSANYVWCTTSVLGKGATGAVFQGVSKYTGEPVAVKTFNQVSHMRPYDVQMREFEVLKKVKHENIVKLLAIEEEQERRGNVIVMELCNGGSLFTILDDPENSYGLQEDEFLLVVDHLSAGMKHLRDNNLVHRDLKPGNIMKYISANGNTIYKLTDFGAARELDDGQQFMSLYGTEEYLHPDMYERAVLRKPVGKSFGATVDLWSIGVTLYHVATGNLPFRPYGGRKNKKTMHYITTKKASGVISGVQTSENGSIEWSEDLPSSCLLSAGVKKLVNPLLAGLLEANPEKMWNFDNFFAEVTSIVARKKLHVFYVNKLQSLRIYMHSDDNLEDFQCLVLEQTDVDLSHQILLFNNNFLRTIVLEKTPGKSFPKTEEGNPIILFSKENNNVALCIDKKITSFPTFSNMISTENDANLAKSTCTVGYVYKRRVEYYSLCSAIMNSAVHLLAAVISEQLQKVEDCITRCKAITRGLGNQLQLLKSSQRHNLALVHIVGSEMDIAEVEKRLGEIVKEQEEVFNSTMQQLMELEPAVQQLHTRYVRDHHLVTEWKEVNKGVTDLTKAPTTCAIYLAKMRESWQHLLRDRTTRTLTYNDEQFHNLEKIKMQETVKAVVALLNSECQPVVIQQAECLADWYKMAQTVFLQTEILQKDITAYENKLDMFMLSLNEAEENVGDVILNLVKKYKSEKSMGDREDAPVCVKSRSQEQGTIRKYLKELADVQEEVWTILKENSQLVQQFQDLDFKVAAESSLEPEN